MDDFEFLRYITIGQYLPLGSLIHRLDPRFKLLAFICLVTGITFASSYLSNVLLLVLVLLLVYFSRVPLGYSLSGLRPALPFVVLIFAMQVLFYTTAYAGRTGCVSFLQWGPIDSNSCGLQFAIISIFRFIDLLILTSLLTLTTTITELTGGLERLLSPFQRLNLPSHELALMLTIALRFVPTLAEEMERIVKAQVSRGADLGRRGTSQFVRQTQALLPLIVPLFLNALRRAEDLVLAMESRCYIGGRGRTHLVRLESRPADFIALALAILVAAFVLLYPFPF